MLRPCVLIVFIVAWPSADWHLPTEARGWLGACLLLRGCRTAPGILLFNMRISGHWSEVAFCSWFWHWTSWSTGICGQFCSSEISKTIKFRLLEGAWLRRLGEGWRGFRGACRADKTPKMNRSCNVTITRKENTDLKNHIE